MSNVSGLEMAVSVFGRLANEILRGRMVDVVGVGDVVMIAVHEGGEVGYCLLNEHDPRRARRWMELHLMTCQSADGAVGRGETVLFMSEKEVRFVRSLVCRDFVHGQLGSVRRVLYVQAAGGGVVSRRLLNEIMSSGSSRKNRYAC